MTNPNRTPTSPLKLLQAATTLLCALVTCFVWSVASPIGASPDDNFHLPSIWCGRGAVPQQCALQPAPPSAASPASITSPAAPKLVAMVPSPLEQQVSCFAFQVSQSAACQGMIQDWSSLELVPSAWNNTTAEIYPPGFYYAMSFFVRPHVKHSALLMRGVNGVLAVLLIGVLIVLAAGSEIECAVILSVLVASIPLGVFIIPSTNPSSWTVTGVGTYWGFLYLLVRERRPARQLVAGVAALLAAFLAIFSRVDGSLYILLATAVTVLALSPSLRDLLRVCCTRRLWVVVIPVAVLAVYLFGWHGQGVKVVQSGLQGGAGPTRTVPQLLFYNLMMVASLWSGALGGWGLGWLDTNLSPTVPLVVFSIAFFLIVSGLQGARVCQVGAFCVVLAALTVVPVYVLTRAGQLVGETVQPRYLLPLLYLALGVALIQRKPGLPAALTRGTTTVFMVLLALAHSIALHQNIRRYVTGVDFIDFDLNKRGEWWWNVGPTPHTVWLIGAVSFLCLAVLLGYQLQRSTRRRPEPAPTEAQPGC